MSWSDDKDVNVMSLPRHRCVAVIYESMRRHRKSVKEAAAAASTAGDVWDFWNVEPKGTVKF